MNVCKLSPEYPVSPKDPNQAQLQLENPGDIIGDINKISTDISMEENTENQVQSKIK
jgi:hypothetical protein